MKLTEKNGKQFSLKNLKKEKEVKNEENDFNFNDSYGFRNRLREQSYFNLSSVDTKDTNSDSPAGGSATTNAAS